MEQSEMEVDSSETVLTKTDVSCLQTTPSLPEKSSGSEPSGTVESSTEATPTDKTQVEPIASSPTNTQSASSNEETPQAIPSDHSTNSQAVSSEQTSVSQLLSSEGAVSSSAVPPSSKVPSLPGPSSEAAPSSVASKLTNGPASKKQRLDYSSMSTGVYLDSTVVPILHLALVTLDRLRPEDPVQYVIDFLLRHKAQYSKAKEHPAPSASANQA